MIVVFIISGIGGNLFGAICSDRCNHGTGMALFGIYGAIISRNVNNLERRESTLFLLIIAYVFPILMVFSFYYA